MKIKFLRNTPVRYGGYFLKPDSNSECKLPRQIATPSNIFELRKRYKGVIEVIEDDSETEELPEEDLEIKDEVPEPESEVESEVNSEIKDEVPEPESEVSSEINNEVPEPESEVESEVNSEIKDEVPESEPESEVTEMPTESEPQGEVESESTENGNSSEEVSGDSNDSETEEA